MTPIVEHILHARSAHEQTTGRAATTVYLGHTEFRSFMLSKEARADVVFRTSGYSPCVFAGMEIIEVRKEQHFDVH